MTCSRALFRASVALTISAACAGALMLPATADTPTSPGQPAENARPASAKNLTDLSRSKVDKLLASSTDYLNPDGSHTEVLAAHPVNYLVNGSYRPIDNRVVADPEVPGSLVNAGNSWRVHFRPVRDGLSFITTTGSIGIQPVGTNPVTPARAADGSSVSYQNAWPGADLDYTVIDSGVKESVMVKSPNSPSSYSFAISTGTKNQVLARSGAEQRPVLREQEDGSVTGDGPLATTYFAAPMVLRADGEPMEGAHAKLTASAGRLVLSLDPGWLARQPAAAFPINLDPSIFPDYSSAYSYKSDGYSCHNCGVQFGNSRDNSDTEWRTVAHYSYESLFGQEIVSSELDTGWQGGSQNAYGAKVYWASNYSFYGATGHPTVLATGNPGGTTGTLSGAALTNQIKSWADTSTSGGAFGFVGTETAGLYTYQKYDIKLYVSYNAPPTLSTNIKFNTASPSAPTSCTNTANTIDGSQPSSWKATMNAPTPRNMTANFLWWDGASPSVTHLAVSGTYPTGSTNSLAWVKGWPAGQFLDGHTYYWKTRGNDGVKTGPWNSTCVFKVSNPVANAPANPGFGASNPGLPCGSAVRGDLGFVLHATINNPGPAGQQVRAEFVVSYAGATPQTYTTSFSAATPQFAQVSVPGNTVAGQFSIPNNTPFTWTVATRTLTDNKLSALTQCSGQTSAGAQLSAPVITGDSQLATGTATVGDTRSVSFTDTASDPVTGVQKYVYSFSDDLPDLSTVSCGDLANVGTGPIYGLLCATDDGDASGNTWNTADIVVPSTAFSIYAWAIDATGTISAMATATYTAADISGAQESHLWETDSQDTVNSPNTVADVITTGPIALNTTANASTGHWTSGTDGAPWAGPSSNGTALHFDGTNGWAGAAGNEDAVPLDTSNNIWDASDNFSVQAWVRPTAASPATGWNVALSQDGNSVSGFMLGQSNGNWEFCMPETQNQGTGYDGECATLPQLTGYVNTWVLLTGVWDASGGTITLYVADGLSSTQPPSLRSATVAHTESAPAEGQFAVGRGQWNGANAYYWTGDIEDPSTWLGLMSSDQIGQIAAIGPYNPNNQ